MNQHRVLSSIDANLLTKSISIFLLRTDTHTYTDLCCFSLFSETKCNARIHLIVSRLSFKIHIHVHFYIEYWRQIKWNQTSAVINHYFIAITIIAPQEEMGWEEECFKPIWLYRIVLHSRRFSTPQRSFYFRAMDFPIRKEKKKQQKSTTATSRRIEWVHCLLCWIKKKVKA